MTDPQTHSAFEDFQGLLAGAFLCATALLPLATLGLVTGQTAGLAILLSYLSDYSFGAIFFVINLPFFALAYLRMGARFTVKTTLAVALVSLIAETVPKYVSYTDIHPLVAVLLFGTMSGAGLLAIFRHGASLGGIGILALYLQDKTGFKAGWTQLIFDVTLFSVAAIFFPLKIIGWSLVGAVVVNVVIAVNHRKDRYIAM